MHDFNGGLLGSGLFWTLPLADDAVRISRDGRRAVMEAEQVQVIDSFQFGSGIGTPATVDIHIEWKATAAPVPRGTGTGVGATDPAAFLGRFAVADATAVFSGAEFGFSFRSDPGVNTERGFAELGQERNGVFL